MTPYLAFLLNLPSLTFIRLQATQGKDNKPSFEAQRLFHCARCHRPFNLFPSLPCAAAAAEDTFVEVAPCTTVRPLLTP